MMLRVRVLTHSLEPVPVRVFRITARGAVNRLKRRHVRTSPIRLSIRVSAASPGTTTCLLWCLRSTGDVSEVGCGERCGFGGIGSGGESGGVHSRVYVIDARMLVLDDRKALQLIGKALSGTRQGLCYGRTKASRGLEGALRGETGEIQVIGVEYGLPVSRVSDVMLTKA